MSTLADLFDDDRGMQSPIDPDERGAADARLAEMLGGSRRTFAAPVDDTSRLVSLVQSAVESAAPVVVPGSSPKKSSSRGHRRTDWLSAVAAALALGAVSATGAFAGIQYASASPAAGALTALAVDEAAVTNAQLALVTAASRIEADVATGLEDAARVEQGLAAVVEYSEEPARAATVQALADYRAALQAVVLPELPPAYMRPSLDQDSLAEVAAAINDVQALSTEVAEKTEEVRTVRDTVTALRGRFVGQVVAFGATFPAWAEAVNAENDEPDQSYRDAVTAAAAAVPTSQVDGQLGVDAMIAFPPFVDELRNEQQRILDVIAAEEEAGRNPGFGGSGGGSSEPEPQPTDPSTGNGTDPGVPPAAVDPPAGDATE